MKRRSILSLVLVGLLSVGLLSGCGGDNGNNQDANTGNETPATESSEAPADTDEPETQSSSSGKDTLIVATENETTTLHPWDHSATASTYMNLLTFDSLYSYGMDLEPYPNLVESAEAVDEDGMEWNFTLKQGIMFHNGEEMTAEDVVASLYATKEYTPSYQYTEAVESAEVTGDYTFTITTSQPATLFYDLCHHANHIVPKSLIEAGHDFAQEPIGSGPYVFTSWARGDRLEFKGFEDYHDPDRAAKIPNLTVRVIPEGASRAIAIETGEVDFIIEVPTTDIENLRANENINILEQSGTTHNYIMINGELEPFNNPLVRRAINLAIDKEAIVEVATNGIGDVAISQAPFGFLGSTDENAEEYNPELAKELFAESGVDPSSFEFTVICSNDQKRRTAEVIQAYLLELGINTVIDSMDLATYLDVTNTTGYVAAIGNYTASNMIAYLQGVHYSPSINASNRSRYSNPEVDRLIDEARTTVDDAKRQQILEECVSLINIDTPQVPLYQDKLVRAYHKDLGGVQASASGTLYFNEVYWK